jgi:hypothetical protein
MPELLYRCASEVQIKPIDWLWPNYLARGKVSLFDGDPGLGKSIVTMEIAARVSTGTRFPDGTRCEPTNVVVVNMDDSPEDTVVPRLKAAEADLNKIFIIDAVKMGKDENRKPFQLPSHKAELVQLIEQQGASLVILDPLVACLAENLDVYKAQDMYRAMFTLSELARNTGVCVLGVRHLNKMAEQRGLYRGTGSISVVGTARTAFMFVRDPENPAVTAMVNIKTNLTARPLGWRYLVHDSDGTPFIEWLESTTKTVEEFLSGKTGGPKKGKGAKHLKDQLLTAISSLRNSVVNGVLPLAAVTIAMNANRGHQEQLTDKMVGGLLGDLGFHKRKTANGATGILWDEILLGSHTRSSDTPYERSEPSESSEVSITSQGSHNGYMVN